MNKMTKEQVAWLAGLFEGEGCVVLPSYVRAPLLRLSSTDQDVVLRCHEYSGVGNLFGPYSFYSPKNKPAFVWSVSKSGDVKDILLAILPHLGSRRTVAANKALDRIKDMRVAGFCKRGHPLNEIHLYVSAKGKRCCRTCNTTRQRDKRHELKFLTRR